ncbi:hypothetical protein [Adhaeretor mobilis]|nr:hypothetical protein [Adhaeretor mobilis]
MKRFGNEGYWRRYRERRRQALENNAGGAKKCDQADCRLTN